jgi:NADPH:quinone reductase-like Zn-dependent oxidoreductase
MKAFVVERYGKDGLRAADVPEPEVGDGDVLVKVSAASINPLDTMVRNGEFKRLLKYQTPFVLGHDVAGVVTAVGSAVGDFQVGDDVYARPRDLRIGTFAQYVAIDEDDVAPKPASLTLHEAGAVPLVSLAAWQALVDRADVQPGQKVLVHAGSGGLGSTVIQLAKHLGATVATTARGENAELVRSLGADVVVDYRKEDFAQVLSGYDVVLDSLGGENLEKSLTVLKPGGQAIGVAGPPDPGFAKQLGAPKFMGVVMGLLSRKVRKQARKLGVSYSFLFHAGQRRAAARTGRPLRRRPPPPAHRQDFPVRPDPRGAGVRRAGPRQRQGRHHARLTTVNAARRPTPAMGGDSGSAWATVADACLDEGRVRRCDTPGRAQC